MTSGSVDDSATPPARNAIADEPDTVAGLRIHPALAVFPDVTVEQFSDLLSAIQLGFDPGPATVDSHGWVLDGRARLRVWEMLGRPITTVTYQGDAFAFVVHSQLETKDLTRQQRQLTAAKIAGRSPGYRESIGAPWSRGHGPGRLRVAATFDLTDWSLNVGRQVTRDGIPELVQLVWDDRVPIHVAARVVSLSVEDQQAFVSEVRRGVKPKLMAPPPVRQRLERRDPDSDRKRPNDDPQLMILQNLARTVNVWADHTFNTFTALDASIHPEDARQINRDLTKGLRALNRVNHLLKERANQP